LFRAQLTTIASAVRRTSDGDMTSLTTGTGLLWRRRSPLSGRRVAAASDVIDRARCPTLNRLGREHRVARAEQILPASAP
jgi:hypothetical protein